MKKIVFFLSMMITSLLGASETPLVWKSLENEVSLTSLPVKGEIPAWIEGTLIRNGPAKFEAGGKRLAHWFDGAAMLHAFHFDQGNIAYVNRFLRTDVYQMMVEEESTDFQGFGQATESVKPKQKTKNANVNISEINGSFVALTEVPLPVWFDPQSLETLGNFDYNDDLPKNDIWESAHPETDSKTGEYFNYFIQFGRTSSYNVYRITPDSAKRELFATIEVPKPSYMHSFSLTENFLVFVETPLVFNPRSFMENPTGSMESRLQWKEDPGTTFTLVDRKTGDVRRIKTEYAFFSWHHVNAYEEGERVVIDLIEANKKGEEKTPLIRYTLLLNENAVTREELFPGPIEMPWINEQLNGKQHRYVYATDARIVIDFANEARLPEEGLPLYKMDLAKREQKTWQQKKCYPGEPVFAAHPDGKAEDEGVILSLVLDTEEENSFLLVLDATTFEEVGRAVLPHHVPFGIHGLFLKK